MWKLVLSYHRIHSKNRLLFFSGHAHCELVLGIYYYYHFKQNEGMNIFVLVSSISSYIIKSCPNGIVAKLETIICLNQRFP